MKNLILTAVLALSPLAAQAAPSELICRSKPAGYSQYQVISHLVYNAGRLHAVVRQSSINALYAQLDIPNIFVAGLNGKVMYYSRGFNPTPSAPHFRLLMDSQTKSKLSFGINGVSKENIPVTCKYRGETVVAY